LADCDFIIETVTEELAVKRRVLEQIERVIPSSAPIGTNSSGFSLAALRVGMRHPGRLVAMHWAEPAYATRFMELVRDNETDRAAFDATMSLVHSLGKDPCVLNRDVDGLVVNRLAYAMYREAIHLVQSGVCDAKTIDRAFRNSVGLWAPVMGPFGWMQFTGLQAYQRVMRRLWPTLSNTVAPPDSLSDVIAETDARPPQELNRAFRENVWRMMRNA
jgi:3-hydroxybutyryl-CoA dehydrogenase